MRNSRLVDISMTSTDPQLAADLANAHARAYIEQNLEYRFSASKDATDWLEGQLAEQRKKVEASEAELQRYKEQHDAVAVEDRQNIVVQRLSDLNGAATKAKTTRIEKEALYNQLRSIQNSNAHRLVPGGAGQRVHPEAEGRPGRSAAAAGRSWRTSTATGTRRW